MTAVGSLGYPDSSVAGIAIPASYGGCVLRVMVRAAGAPPAVLGSGETLLFGRAPQAALPADPRRQLAYTVLTLPDCAPHVSRVAGELTVGAELVRLRWYAA